MRDREPPEREPLPRFMRSEIVRSEIVRSEIRSKVPDRASDSPRSRGMLNQWDLGHRARSPRPIDRLVLPVGCALHVQCVSWDTVRLLRNPCFDCWRRCAGRWIAHAWTWVVR